MSDFDIDKVPWPAEGRLVRLRARELDDEPLLYQWFNDPEVTRHLATIYPVSREEERRRIAEKNQPDYEIAHFLIETIAEGRAIGHATLHPSRPESRAAGLGIAIGEAHYRDRGYGTDATRTLCRFGFEMMNLHRIELEVFDDNPRAIRVYEKVGFRREGVRREAFYSWGRYRNIVVMGLLRGELAEEGADAASR